MARSTKAGLTVANTPTPGRWWLTFPLGLLMTLEIALGLQILIAIWPDVAKVPNVAVATAQTQTTTTTTVASTTPTTAVSPAAATPVATQPGPTHFATVSVVGYHWTDPSPDGLYLVAIIVLAALGASVHALMSFASFMGNRHYVRSWTWWYVAQAPVGIVLAVVFYLALRGGLLAVSTSTGEISPYGIGAIAALVGMFSKQAADKLQEVFDTLFKSAGDAARKDKLTGTHFEVTDICPDSVAVGTTELTVQLIGTNFAAGMKVEIGGVARTSTVVDETHCTVDLLPVDVSSPAVISLTVTGPDATQPPSIAHLRVRPRIDDVQLPAGSNTMTIAGAGFVAESTVEVGGQPRAIVSTTGTSIEASREPTDTRDAVRVRNPDTAGGLSGPPP